MKSTFSHTTALFLFFLFGIFQMPQVCAQNSFREKNVLFFSPEIDPNVEEIKEATYTSLFSEVSDRFSISGNFKMLKSEFVTSYSNPENAIIKDFCVNNSADFAVIPKVKFFKVGIGKYVLSSQVVVSMKLFDSNGMLISESTYDTFKKNARILGSVENSIKLGAKGALKDVFKNLRKHKRETERTS